MSKSFKFILIVIVSQLVSYYIAGIVSQVFLGAGHFYPPSTTALNYLKDPHDPTMQLYILPAQILRGLLIALAILPFRQRILELGKLYGGLAFSGLIFVIGYLAASGGMVEHFVYFKPEYYPARFAAITFIELLVQALIMGWMVLKLENSIRPRVKH